MAADERAYGQAWLVPTNPALTVRQLATQFTEVNGAPKAKLMPIPYPVMWTTGLFSPMIKELRTTRYQFTSPFVIDSSATTEAFGLEPTPMDAALRDARPAASQLGRGSCRIRSGERHQQPLADAARGCGTSRTVCSVHYRQEPSQCG